MNYIDLRSDTVTQPTKKMREVMANAEVGDDVFMEDPTVKKLEKMTSEILGKEASLFLPSGTMANQIAIKIHTRPGETLLMEEESHAYLYEGGAAAWLSGAQCDFWQKHEIHSISNIEKKIRLNNNIHVSPTSLILVENTHNRGAGRVLNALQMHQFSELAKKYKIHSHCDGARIWNASICLNESEKDLVKNFESVSVCFSKGLGAPVGSILSGSEEFILEARRVRKKMGGGMRQSGIIAAGALYAIEHHRERLRDDHENMKWIAENLSSFSKEKGITLHVEYPNPGTNICYFYFDCSSSENFVSSLKESGVLLLNLGGSRYRMLTHLHIEKKDAELALHQIKKTILKFSDHAKN